ncbi:putative acetyltransferase YjbC [Bacillus sp. J14TS2]|uniref:GNAT family N-acetyltransferase n=1 Tax=Bacillus sp. J14TS2 TaxID=2807188 RepID=UPI001B07603F|nr:GNAT family N-acetyltransferase [Bacillus sp. J14TS2]GIN73198.1 putative acetyltransferase YjbC [Bacillus sp. J14TS2]
MSWYNKLNEYFPAEEMKSKKHMDKLLSEKGDIYYKDEGPYHVMMYAEFDSFIFIDYIWVSSKSRGQGIGRTLIEKMKKKNKPILLEVEPIDYDDSDTEKRLRFYNREGFIHAQSIGYKSRSLMTDEPFALEILYWSPNKNETEEDIFKQVQMMYETVHSYKAKEIYGKPEQKVEEVLTFDEQRGVDLMEEKERE